MKKLLLASLFAAAAALVSQRLQTPTRTRLFADLE